MTRAVVSFRLPSRLFFSIILDNDYKHAQFDQRNTLLKKFYHFKTEFKMLQFADSGTETDTIPVVAEPGCIVLY